MEYDSSSINLLRPSIVFVPNRGQAAGSARFIAQTPGQLLYFHEDGVTAVLFSPERNAGEQEGKIKGAVLKIAFAGAASIVLQALNPAAGQLHCFAGNDLASLYAHMPSYEKLRYASLYGGVDLTLSGEKEGLKFLWSLKKAGSVGAIRIRCEGAEELSVSEGGSLIIRHSLGELIDPAPIAWHEIGGERKPVACAYALDGNTVSFTLTGAYDESAPLYIDPVLQYSTYLVGSGVDAVE